MLLADLAAASAVVAATARRSEKVAAVADALRAADADEVEVVVAHLSGELRQRRTGVGWASLRDVPAPAGEPSLGVSEVDAALEEIAAVSGAGSQAERVRRVTDLFARATEPEQRLLRGLLTGELRQGALEGVMLEAVARAAALPAADVRRAAMLRGAVGPVAEAALRGGVAAIAEFRLQVGRPVRPMLASTATDVGDALDRLGEAAVEWKLDGVRVQVHRSGRDVSVWTRSLDEVTDRVPEVIEAALALPVTDVVLDGEAIALRPDGRPRPFQQTGSRMASRVDVAAGRASAPLSTYLFDVLHADGEDVLDRPGRERAGVLARAVPAELRVPRAVTADAAQAAEVLADAVARGHEGVVMKSLDAPYEAGRRGSGWLKVKPRHTLDLVVLAAEWGHGRRRGWLSNLHLGARDPAGGFVMLGKTFKGLTDAMLAWQTERLLELAVERSDWVVTVRPELVVEVAFDGVQTSPRYPGGMALRFARVLRHRPDKTAAEADSVDAVRAVHHPGE
ncbi:MAG TPA: ATP-dependent DNA ligase [Actinomycetes bacterium]|jgi:DNA ligase-1|nr:ATP-dependent DNA ligase [Actinomycetes bacterium]